MSRHTLVILIAALSGLSFPRAGALTVTRVRAIEAAFERIEHPALAPSGDRVVFEATAEDGHSHLFTIAAEGGPATQLTDGAGNDWSPRFSPDGARIAFVSDRGGNPDLWIVEAGGGGPVQVTSGPAGDVDPDWSPDATRLVFASDRGGAYLLYQVTLADKRVYPLTAGAGQDRRPAWSPGDRWIAFQSTRAGGTHIWLIPSEGGEARRLTRGEEREETWPAWLDEGRTLLARSGPHGAPGRLMIFSLRPGGPARSSRLVIPPPEGTRGGAGAPAPSVSRDGRRLVFAGGGKAAIEVIPIRGGAASGVVTSAGRLRHPTWSADGRRLLLAGDLGGTWDLWVAGVATGKLMRLTDDDAREEEPVWSPDGGDVLYALQSGRERILQILEPETRRVIRFSGKGETLASDADPAWSPDGRSVAFSSRRGGSEDLYIAPAGGGEPRRLTGLAGSESHPTWSPAGDWIAFASDQGHGSEIWKIPFQGGEPVRLTRLTEKFAADTQPAWSPAGKWIAFTRRLASPAGGSDIYIIPPAGGRPFPFRRGSGARLAEPAWSPDGSHLAYSHSRPDRIFIAELSEPALPRNPALEGPGTPEGLRRRRQQTRPVQEPGAPDPEPRP